MFQNVDAYAGDPILSLMESFKADNRAHKVNLSIGLYYNEQGEIPQMQAVDAAEAQLSTQPHGTRFIYRWKVCNLTVLLSSNYYLVTTIQCWFSNGWRQYRRWAVLVR